MLILHISHLDSSSDKRHKQEICVYLFISFQERMPMNDFPKMLNIHVLYGCGSRFTFLWLALQQPDRGQPVYRNGVPGPVAQ